MRIAMLHTDLPSVSRGGVAHQVSRLADQLVRRGHDVTVVSFSPPPSGARYEVERIRAPRHLSSTRLGRLLSTPIAFAIRSYARFEVVHAHGDDYLMLWRQRPVVRTFYGSAREEARHAERLPRKIVQRALAVAERVSRRAATVTVGISESTRASIGELDAIIPCGVDRDLFHPGPKSAKPSILFVGTLGGRKRGRVILDLFRDVVRRELPEAELWLVADEHAEGPGIQSFRMVDDETMARLFREAWVFTLPSTYEGFGVPYVEAMASGTAVLATPNDGVRECLAGERAGLVVDDSALPAALVSLLKDDRRRGALAANGRERSARYDWEQVTSRYERVYELARVRHGNGTVSNARERW